MVTVSSILKDVAGVRIGHDTDAIGLTGSTVILFDEMALTAAEVRGAAPGSRDIAMLQPGMSNRRADAILLTGGSAYGLRAADGVMQALREQGRGVALAGVTVPLVPAAVIFDLAVGDAVFPDADAGRRATENARPLSRLESGRIGAGTGAHLGMILGVEHARAGGFGIAQVQFEAGTVTAFAVVNALGVLVDGPLGAAGADPRSAFIDAVDEIDLVPEGQSTTLMAVVIDSACGYDTLMRCCVAAHDALARTIVPAHTAADGDIAFATTLHEGSITREHAMMLTLATELAMEMAIRNAASIPEI
ncbi:MAG: P1 family peptidase [Thermomicrobiales bacterium]